MSEIQTPEAIELTKHRAAAAWMYRKRLGVGWWHPEVLTSENSDSSNLGFEMNEAYDIFKYFQEMGFIKRLGKLVRDGPVGSNDVYAVVEPKIEDFKKFSSLPWHIKNTPEKVFRWLDKFKGWLMVSLILIATSFFQSFFGKLGETLFEFIKSWK